MQKPEVKKRFKMYKAKKHWIVAPIVFLGILGAASFATEHVQAAEVDTQPGTTTSEVTTVESSVQKDTPSQPTKVDEGVSERRHAGQRPAMSNDTTNGQQAVAGTEELTQEQPVVSPEQPTEPLGNPTDVAPADNKANKATTIEKDFATPDVDKAVEAAKKDPNITVVEKPTEDLGHVSSADLAKKEQEVARLQKEQAQKIAQQAAELKAKNDQIAKENAEIAAKNKAEQERYEAALKAFKQATNLETKLVAQTQSFEGNQKYKTFMRSEVDQKTGTFKLTHDMNDGVSIIGNGVLTGKIHWTIQSNGDGSETVNVQSIDLYNYVYTNRNRNTAVNKHINFHVYDVTGKELFVVNHNGEATFTKNINKTMNYTNVKFVLQPGQESPLKQVLKADDNWVYNTHGQIMVQFKNTNKPVQPIFNHGDPQDPIKATIVFNRYKAQIVPVIVPNKEVTDGQKNINDLNVKRGDALHYIITGDTTELAKVAPQRITKQGIRDTFDAEKVTIDLAKVKVYQADASLNEKNLKAVAAIINTGKAKDVTGSYDLTLDQNVVTALMKTNADGSVVLPMGYKYLLVLPFVVKQVTGDFENTAVQLTNDGETITNTVVNHVPDSTPYKDVKADKNGVAGTVSLHEKDIPLETKLFYEIKSSERPENYGGITEEWAMNDVLDTTHDQFTGKWYAVTNFDVNVGNQTLKAGTDITKYVVLTNKDGKDLTFALNQDLVHALNDGVNKLNKQAWSVYLEVNRIKAGDIENTQTETYNKERVRSNTVVTHTPEKPHPTKAVHNKKGEDINNGTVARGDVLSYEMTWDLTGYDKDFAFDTVDIAEGVSFFDDYDETKVAPIKDLLQVKDSKGTDITHLFTVTWDDTKGTVTLAAKDPQAFILEHGGQELRVTLPTKVKANVDGDVYNQATQNTFGQKINTNIVVNHIPKVNPKKDVVIHIGDDQSQNGATIQLGEKFFYAFTSSDIPAKYTGVVEEWSISDQLDVKHDKFSGQWSVFANSDFVLADGTKVAKGDDISKLFTMTFKDGVVVITANKEFLEAMNLKENKGIAHSWKAFIGVERIAAGDVYNTIEESFNNETIKTNTVVTHTPPKQTIVPPAPTPKAPQAPEKLVIEKASVAPKLPHTGEKENTLLSVLGAGMLAGLAWFGFRRKKATKERE